MLVLGKLVWSGRAPASALLRTAEFARPRFVMALADWITESPVSSVSNSCTARLRACDAALLLKPWRPRGAPGTTVAGNVVVPVPIRLLPATERNVGKSGGFIDEMMSAVRPAHPVEPGPLRISLCHSPCWSE